LNFATINRKSNNSPQLFEIMISHKTKLTKAEFWQLADRASDVTYELIKGEAIPKMSPKYFHSRVTLRLSRILEDCLGRNGRVGVEWAFDLAEDSTPVPDLIYVSFERLPIEWNENLACPVPPNLVVEIISPGQSFGQMAAKAQDYLLAGVQQVWIIDPSVQSLTILYPDQSPRTFLDKATLPADFLPKMTVTVDQLFR
jgi:Uma2 family endonuclease